MLKSTNRVVFISLGGLVVLVIVVLLVLSQHHASKLVVSSGTNQTQLQTNNKLSEAGLNINKLSSLVNYTATMTDNGFSIPVSVHSPTDWENNLSSSPIIYINGYSYAKSINAQGQPVWYRNAISPLFYQQSDYIGAVNTFIDFAKVAGVTISKGTACSVASIAGQTWTISLETNNIVSAQESACVANQSGALLNFEQGKPGKSGTNAYSYTFTITGINNVPLISIPSPVSNS